MNHIKQTESDGERLKKRFEALKKENGMGKAEFARLYKVPGGGSMISQNISGHRPISLEAAVAYMTGFGCNMEEISPTLAAQLPKESQGSASNKPPALVDTTLAAINNLASIEQLMAGLSDYLVQMDDYARDNAADVLRRLTAKPEEHARAAALFATAFQSGKRRAA